MVDPVLPLEDDDASDPEVASDLRLATTGMKDPFRVVHARALIQRWLARHPLWTRCQTPSLLYEYASHCQPPLTRADIDLVFTNAWMAVDLDRYQAMQALMGRITNGIVHCQRPDCDAAWLDGLCILMLEYEETYADIPAEMMQQVAELKKE